MTKLEEKKRRELVNQSKSGRNYASKEGNRFKRRLKCRLPSNSSAYENIDMDKLFKKDILEANINVVGETGTYEVIISFADVLAELQKLLKERNTTALKLNIILRAVIRAFDRNDVFIHCSCEDFQYRFNFWATVDHYNAGDLEMRPTDETNPHGDLGSCCKHGLLVLNKQTWIIKVASVINNYIRYMRLRNPRLYQKFIYPAIFPDGNEPDDTPRDSGRDERQMSMFDDYTEEPETPEQTGENDVEQQDNIDNKEEEKDNETNS